MSKTDHLNPKEVILFLVFTMLLMVLSYFLFEAILYKQGYGRILGILLVLSINILILYRYYIRITKNFTKAD
ncbi:MAG: hypothetical protein ABI761_07885 [Saprospiraceae bacterium]